MKKILSCILTIVLLCSLFLPVLAEEEELIYIYGGSSNKNRAKLKTQGQQSWYMMYSLEINKGEEIDLTTFKECVQTETGMWKPAEPAVIPGSDPAKPDTMVTFTGDWFNIRKDGFLAGDTGYSAALKWVCEQDGYYDVAVNFSGGSSDGYAAEGYYDPNGGWWVPPADGCFMGMWIKEDMMFCEDTWEGEGHRLPRAELEFNYVDMKAGDVIWLVCDTKENGGWDDPWFHLTITRVGDLEE